MKKLFSILLLTLTFCAYAQEDNRGTIKVQKKGNVYAVMFDNVNNRLIGQDNYGNILDSAVISYNVMLTIQGIAYEEKVLGTTLSNTMQNRIKRVDGRTTLFFTDIKVKEKNGKVIDWPKFNVKLGGSFETEEQN